MKAPKKTTLLRNAGGKERREARLPYICSMCSRCRVVFLYFFSPIVPWYGSLFMRFRFCLVSVPFTGPSLLEMKFCRNFFTLVSVWGGGGVVCQQASHRTHFENHSFCYSPPSTPSADIHKLYIHNGVLWCTEQLSSTSTRGKQRKR